jgi:hypothetical protein
LACYFLVPELWDNEQYPIIPADQTTSFIEQGCTTPTEEADAIHIEMNANLAALTATRFSSGNLLDHNLIFQVTEPLDGNLGILSREGVHKIRNQRKANCAICGSIK